MYNVHQDATLIPTELSCEEYTYEGKSIPALTASASERDGITSITLTNAHPSGAADLTIEVGDSLKVAGGQIVTGKQMTDYNDFGEKAKVTLQEFDPGKVRKGSLLVEIPAKSVVLIQLEGENAP
jgi:alpha-N-arabinofuranosidase